MNTQTKKILKFLLKFSVSAILMALLIFSVQWEEVFAYMRKVSFLYLALYVFVLLVGISISSYKWMILARHKGFKFPLGKFFQLYLTGAFINNFFPSFIGGDAYRAYHIGKKDKKYLASGTAVAMDRITGLLGAMILSVIGAFLNWNVIGESPLLLYVFYALVLTLVAFVALVSLKNRMSVAVIEKYMPKIMRDVLKDFSTYKDVLGKSIWLSCLYSLVGLAILNYILFFSLGISISFLQFLSVIFLISIVSSIPISINNIGIKEWAYVTFFGLFGVSASAVVAIALLSRILQMLVSFTALPMYLKNRS